MKNFGMIVSVFLVVVCSEEKKLDKLKIIMTLDCFFTFVYSS